MRSSKICNTYIYKFNFIQLLKCEALIQVLLRVLLFKILNVANRILEYSLQDIK